MYVRYKEDTVGWTGSRLVGMVRTSPARARPAPANAARVEMISRGGALKGIQKEAGIGCCTVVLLNIVSTLLSIFTGSLTMWLDALTMILTGSPLVGRILGYTLIRTETLKPWKACCGYLIYIVIRVPLSFLPCLVLPGCCCGTPNQSFLDQCFGVMWVSSSEYNAYLVLNKAHIVDFQDSDDDAGCCGPLFSALLLFLVFCLVAGFVAPILIAMGSPPPPPRSLFW